MLIEKCKKKSLRGNKILFCGRGLKRFSPLKGTRTKHYFLLYFHSFRNQGIEGLSRGELQSKKDAGVARRKF